MTTSLGSSALLTDASSPLVRRDYRGASLLPKRTYHDPAIFDWERDHVLRRDWILVARVEDVPEPGTYMRLELEGDPLIVVHGRDGVLRAFHNVCRHRGTAVAEEACGKVVRFQCPYHAWIYDLDGSLIRAKHTEDLDDFSFDSYGLASVRLETWQGFIFLNLDPDAASLATQLGDLVEHFGRFDFTGLRSAKRIEYEVGANWKFIAENYSECYHCPGVHPQLNKLTPYDVGGDFDPDGAWQGGWMELADGAETMALDGGHGSRDGRPPMSGITPDDERCVYYYVLWPHDVPVDPPGLPARPSARAARRGSDAGHLRLAVRGGDDGADRASTRADEVAFWDLTNRQDWHVCELQQQGTRSSSWVAGRYSNAEASVHAFDQMVADRYVGETSWSKRIVRERYDEPTPRSGADRTGARAKATAAVG